MLRRLLPVAFLALLLLPSAALANEGMGPKEYVTELFIGLIIGVIAIFAIIAGFEARNARRKSSH